MRRLPPPSPGFAAVGVLLAAAALCFTSPARAEGGDTVFAGVAVRDPAADALAERAAVALAQVLEKRGVLDIGTPPLPVVVDADDPVLENAVSAAVSRYQEADFSRALDRADEAIGRFEKRLAFVVGGPWAQYGRALLVKSLAERKLGRDDDADATLRRLAATRPTVPPDPALATPSLLAHYQALLEEQQRKDRVQIEITSTPSGADVVVDGEPRGKAPVVVRDLLPGTHFVSLQKDGVVEERTVPALANVRVDVPLGDPRADMAKALRAAVAARGADSELIARAAAVGEDVLFGLWVPDAGGGKPAVVVARVLRGELSVAGTFVEDKAALRARIGPVADALLDGVVSPEGAFIPAAPGSPRALLFEAAPVTAPPIAEVDGESDAPWLIAAGVGAGVLVVAVGVVAGVWLALQAGEEVHVVVDASQL